MIQNRKSGIVVLLSMVAVVTACNAPLPRTHVERVAKAAAVPNAPYSRVLVVAMLPRGSTARELEEVLVSEIRDGNTYAFGYRRAASRADVDEQVLRSIAEAQQADSVIVVSAQLVDTSLDEKQQRTGVQSRVIGGNLLDFFRYEYDEYAVPPEADPRMNVRLFTDLYDAATEQRVYAMESATERAMTNSEAILAEGQAIATRLHKDRMIR